MPIVLLGNTAATHLGQILPGNRITTANVPDEYSSSERLLAITARADEGSVHDGVWASCSANQVPSWVESTDPDLEQALANHYGCPVGRPEGWES